MTPALVYAVVTTILATFAAPVVLVSTAAVTLAVPDDGRPVIASPVFVQEYTVPATAPPNVTAVFELPLHITSDETVLTVGLGFTVIVNIVGAPVQVVPPLEKVGVTVILETCAVAPVLIAVKALIVPVPVAVRPMVVLSLAQL